MWPVLSGRTGGRLLACRWSAAFVTVFTTTSEYWTEKQAWVVLPDAPEPGTISGRSSSDFTQRLSDSGVFVGYK